MKTIEGPEAWTLICLIVSIVWSLGAIVSIAAIAWNSKKRSKKQSVFSLKSEGKKKRDANQNLLDFHV